MDTTRNKKHGYVYILTNYEKTVLYVGVTSNLERRITEHKTHAIKGFTDKYNVTNLVYVEAYDTIEEAISREKQLKRWSRTKKVTLIESLNPTWNELSC